MRKSDSLWIHLLIIISETFTTKGEGHWNYDNTHWEETCGSGKMQSPINLDIGSAVITHFGPIQFHNYDTKSHITASNNGHTEIMEGFTSWNEKPYITGGSLAGKYYLRQFHLHWGEADSTGSEHTLNRVHYPMEAHFVHFLEGYDEKTAGTVKGSIVVVAIMLQVDNKEDALQSLEEAIAATKSSENKIELQEYSPAVMLPNDTTTFFRYEGSLTTPPCTEGVIWIILAEPKNVLEQELNFLRQHVTSEGRSLSHNFREVQPLNGRTVSLNRMGNSGAFPTTIIACLVTILMAFYELNVN